MAKKYQVVDAGDLSGDRQRQEFESVLNNKFAEGYRLHSVVHSVYENRTDTHVAIFERIDKQ